MEYVLIVAFAMIVGYLYGSIPFSFLVGKIIYRKDIRLYGSGNVGGGNLGRTCGKLAFILGFLLDASKGVFAVWFALFLNINPLFIGLAVLIGHAFSIFMNFKGGKGVATACGFVLAYSFWGAIFALIIFAIVLYTKKYLSLASIVAIGAYLIYSCIFQNLGYTLSILVLYIFIIYLHRKNLSNIKNRTEPKITWI